MCTCQGVQRHREARKGGPTVGVLRRQPKLGGVSRSPQGWPLGQGVWGHRGHAFRRWRPLFDQGEPKRCHCPGVEE